MEAVDEVLRDLSISGPALLAFNKVDQLTYHEESALRSRTAALYGPHVLTTVREEGGLEPLRSALRDRMRADRPMVHITLAAKDGRTLAEAYREGEVLERRENGGSIELTARVPAAVVGRWRRKQGVHVTSADAV